MGCCLGAVLLSGAPRLALILWWFFDPARVEGAFNWTTVIAGWTVPVWLWAVLGFVLLPWVTVALVFVAPGGIAGFEWAILVIALLFDLGAVGGGREAHRRRT
jgi:hypothetical protein